MPSVALSLLLPTLTTNDSSWARLSEVAAVTVTEVAPAPSLTLVRFNVRSTVRASSSVSVSVAELTVSPGPLPDTVMLSFPSTSLSCVGVSVNVPDPLFWPPKIRIGKSVTLS